MASLGASASHILAGKRLMVRDSDEVFDRDFVSSNIGFMARYVVAITLSCKEQFERALPIFEEIRQDANNLRRVHKDRRRAFIRSFCRLYSNALHLSTRALGAADAAPAAGEMTKVKERLDKALEIDPENPNVRLGIAIVCFWEGRIDKAREHVLTARRVSRGRDPAAHLSLAFLDFYEDHFVQGWRHLQRMLDLAENMNAVTFFDAIRFCDDVLDAEPERVGLLFHLGVLNYELADRARGIELLVQFRDSCERQGEDAKGMEKLLLEADSRIGDDDEEKGMDHSAEHTSFLP
jgi:tetratricopeptide (TPR) repeat protein